MCAVYFWLISKLVNTNIIGNMPRGDHCAVWGCNNDRRYPEKQTIFPDVGILRFYSPKSKKDVLSWARSINRDHFKVTMSTKVCSNNFAQGYRKYRNPTMYIKGYNCESKSKRPPPKIRSTQIKESRSRKRKRRN